jgi:hypothetical protein
MIQETDDNINSAGEEEDNLESLCEQYQLGVKVLIEKEGLSCNMGREMLKLYQDIEGMQDRIIALERGDGDILGILNQISVANARLSDLSNALHQNMSTILELNAGLIDLSKEIAV